MLKKVYQLRIDKLGKKCLIGLIVMQNQSSWIKNIKRFYEYPSEL
jgi:hypothetical protein